VRDLSEAIRLGGTVPNEALYFRGQSRVEIWHPKEAIVDLMQCLRSCDLSVAGKINVYQALGKAHSQLHQFDLAVSDYTEIIDRLFPLYCPNPCRTPYSADSYYRDRGVAYMMGNKLSVAIRDFTEAIQRARTGSDISPKDQDIEVASLMFRVLAYAKMGKKKEAIADLKAMKELCQPLRHLKGDTSGMLAEICTLSSSKFHEFVAAAKDDKELSYRPP
jgi:tetratricopeptide (TPR) repeat protein